jgi:hypothetical protein
MISSYDWRGKDETWQQRQFMLSAFVRSKITITAQVYEFCDHAISQGYGKTLETLDLREVDPWLTRMFREWQNHTK